MDYLRRDIPVCEVCQKPASQQCGGCKLVYYCSRPHQKLGWREGHKFKCCAFKVQYSDTLGRHMIATRDIEQGEMILKEKPAIVAPKMSTPVNCLSCYKRLDPEKQKDGKYNFYKCTSCGWPMCDQKCEKAEIHKAECKLMTEKKFQCTIGYETPDKCEPAYCVIGPLRVLLLKESNVQQYENIMALESHLEERISTPLYKVLKANLVTFLTQVLTLPYEEEEILKIASIFDTNSFEVRRDGGRKFRGIYITASMMAHDCTPNTKHVFMGDESHLALIATSNIPNGKLITATYTQSLWGTLDRRSHLYSAKCFYCECSRCKDPSELGTHLGNIYCSVCNGPGGDGTGMGSMMLSTNPLDETAKWKCEKCDHTILAKQMIWGNNALKDELSKLDKKNPKYFEDFIMKYKFTLHPNNYHVVQAKYALVQIYGNAKGYNLKDLTDIVLQRKIDLCIDILDIADKIEPGWSKFRGQLLLELQAAMVVQTMREYESDKLTKAGAQDKLMECLSLIQEAANILKNEPELRDTLEERIQQMTSMLDSIPQDPVEVKNEEPGTT